MFKKMKKISKPTWDKARNAQEQLNIFFFKLELV